MSCATWEQPAPLDYYLGDSAPIVLDFVDEETGESFDLTGCTLTAMLKASLDDADSAALFTKTSSSGISLLTTSRAAIYPTEAETAALTADTTYFLCVVVRDTANRVAAVFNSYLHALARGILSPA